MKSGRVKRGWLGVHIQAVTEEIAETLGLKRAEGALVASVKNDSPAAKGKIKAGDVIIEFDGKIVKEMRSLPRIVAETEVGKPVKVLVWRDGKDKELSVSVGELKDNKKIVSAGTDAPAKEMNVFELGLTLTAINDKVRQRFKLKEDTKGVVITNVDDKGPTSQKEIRPGDVITEVSQQEVSSPADVKRKIADAIKADRKSILLHLDGQNGLRFVAVRLRKK